MDRQLKQRVVGAALLVAFGVVFIPIFLDNEALDEAIPPAFELPPSPAPTAQPPTLEAAEIEALERSIDEPPPPPEPPAEPPAHESAPAVPAPAAASAEPVASPAQIEPERAPEAPVPDPAAAAWALQLGSFASEQNARGLAAKLEAGGRRSYVERRVENGATVFKVRIGPLATRAEAERARGELERDYATRGMLLPYP